MKKEKLKTCQEICNRLRWDPQFDEGDFIVCYEGRYEGLSEMSLPEFRYSEIPWHRVHSLKGPDGVVWDRERRLDRISGSGDTPAVAVIKNKEEELKKPAAESLLSINVLFDCYDDVDVRAAERWPYLLDFLAQQQPTFIALQEVTPSFMTLLEKEEWVKKDYNLSDGHLSPFGPLLLSQEPIHDVHWPSVGRGNRAMIATLSDKKIAVLHLTSDYRKKKSNHRQREIAAVLESIGNGPAIICGDFNFAKEEEAKPLLEAGFVDTWTQLRPNEAGVTYDPDNNELARQSSLTGRQSRLDRIYLRGGLLTPQSIEIVATEPVADVAPLLFLSDHYGLKCTLQPCIEESIDGSIEVTSPAVHRSALCIIPPRHLWPTIQSIRHGLDRQYLRWPPHINLLYGFVGEDEFKKAAPKLSSVLKDFPPFTITLKEFSRFDHRHSSTVWLRPESSPHDKIRQLQSLLEETFPQCDEQSSRGPNGFTPHLSVGQMNKGEKYHQAFKEISFQVHELALISRREEQPFAIRGLVPLGTSSKDNRRQERYEITDTLIAACRKTSGGECVVTGSTLLESYLPHSDVDLLVLGPHNLSAFEFTARLEAELGMQLKKIDDAYAPIITGSFQGLKIDLAYARCPQGLAPRPPAAFRLDELTHFGEDSRLAITGYLNTLSLLEQLPTPERRHNFRKLLRQVRQWARDNRVDDNAFGYLGGYSWALLTCWFMNSTEKTTITDFFAKLADWDWLSPITTTKAAREYKTRSRDRMAIITPIPPVTNSARSVTKSTKSHLITLFKANPLQKPTTSIEVKVPPGYWGIARGNLISLLLTLEEKCGHKVLAEKTESQEAFMIHVYKKIDGNFLQKIIDEWEQKFLANVS